MEGPLIEKLKIYNATVQRKCGQFADVRRGPFESPATFTGLMYSFFTARNENIILHKKKKKKQITHTTFC